MASGGPESAPTSSPQRTSSDHPRRPLIRTAAHPPHRNPAHPPHRNPAAPGDVPHYREGMDGLTYDQVGATAGVMPAGYHHVRARRVVGRGPADFERAADALLAGEAQRRAGARVELSETPMREGTRVTMRLGLGILSFRIPCLVVWAERSASVAGFAYGTLPGHPERGEERFTLSLAPSGEVVFEIAAFSKPGRWFTRVGAPLGRLVQAWMTRRYLRAL